MDEPKKKRRQHKTWAGSPPTAPAEAPSYNDRMNMRLANAPTGAMSRGMVMEMGGPGMFMQQRLVMTPPIGRPEADVWAHAQLPAKKA